MADTEPQVTETATTEQKEENVDKSETAQSTEQPIPEIEDDVAKEEEPEEEIEYECPYEFNEREEMCKMFVGGLNKETTDDELKELFASYGEIKDLIIIRKENNKSDRLFGFITFTKCDDLEECLLKRPHKYKEKELDVRRAVPRSQGSNSPDFLGHQKVKKLHVANVPKVFEPKTLQKYLQARHPKKYGTIDEIKFIKSKDNESENKGFGFIMVSSEDLADRISIGESKFTLDGHVMRISKAKAKVSGGRFQGQQFQQQGWGNDWGNLGGGYSGYGGYGGGYDNYYGGYGGGYGSGYYGGRGYGGGNFNRYKPY